MESRHQPDGLTQFLFRLPAELRDEIYSHVVPGKRKIFDVFSEHRELPWLATSQAIFEEAAPLIYSSTPLYFDLAPEVKTRRGSIAAGFAAHVQTTYKQDQAWTGELIRSKMAKRVMMELYCNAFDDLHGLFSWLYSQSLELSRFSTMEELCVSIKSEFLYSLEAEAKARATLEFANLVQTEHQRKAIFASDILQNIGQTTRLMLKNFPSKCVVKWSFQGEVLPHVTFLSLFHPEVAQDERERLLTRFMEKMCLFVNSHSDEQLKEVGIGS